MSDLYKMRETMNQIFDTLEDHAKKIEDQGNRISALEKKLSTSKRNEKIINDVRKGKPSKEVAEEYGISPARVAQIAPRRFN
ncbi:hypothetical protein D3C80_712840 [compost metagenome]|jgi:FixJ family two-component response regulator